MRYDGPNPRAQTRGPIPGGPNPGTHTRGPIPGGPGAKILGPKSCTTDLGPGNSLTARGQNHGAYIPGHGFGTRELTDRPGPKYWGQNYGAKILGQNLVPWMDGSTVGNDEGH